MLFPHHKVDEQPNKKPKKERPFLQKKKNDDKNAVAIVKIVSQMGLCLARLGVLGFSKRQTGPWKPDAKSLWTDSKNAIHSVYATSSNYPGKERTIAWTNASQSSSSA